MSNLQGFHQRKRILLFHGIQKTGQETPYESGYMLDVTRDCIDGILYTHVSRPILYYKLEYIVEGRNGAFKSILRRQTCGEI